MLRLYRSLCRFSLDHSNLDASITTKGIRNYTIEAEDPIPGYLVNPNSSRTVIMIHEWWGLNNSICETADIFAALGHKYKIFVPDLYRSSPAKNSDQATHLMGNLDWTSALQDIKTIKRHFDNGDNNVSIVGFCMGGALTLASLANISGFRAGASFYGVPNLNEFKVENIVTRTLAHFGEQDPCQGFSCTATAHKLQEKANISKIPIEVKIWPNVNHAFCNQNSRYFNEHTRNQAFKLTQQFFDQQ